jgi:hypothetical protein
MEKDELEELRLIEELRHKNRVQEIELEAEAQRKLEAIKFDHQMQLQRIRSAEIKRTIDRRSDREFAEGYARR